MENWGFSVGKSADQLGDYLSYALKILKNAGLACEGITTPGGFGNRALPELAQGTLQACRDVFQVEIPHYFRHIFTDERSVAPRVEYASGLDGPDPRCVVSIIGCTGDWFGGWDGLTPGSVDQFITADLKGGRLPEVIARGEPAILVCHWPGMYFNGQEIGFKIFQEVVRRLHDAYDHLTWMKLSQIARYWAARELTRIERPAPGEITISGPVRLPRVHCPGHTGRRHRGASHDSIACDRRSQRSSTLTRWFHAQLSPGTFHRHDATLVACFDLAGGIAACSGVRRGRLASGSRPSEHARRLTQSFGRSESPGTAQARPPAEPGRRGPIRRHDRQADQGPEPEDVQTKSRDEKDASGFRVHDHTPVEFTRIDRIGRSSSSRHHPGPSAG